MLAQTSHFVGVSRGNVVRAGFKNLLIESILRGPSLTASSQVGARMIGISIACRPPEPAYVRRALVRPIGRLRVAFETKESEHEFVDLGVPEDTLDGRFDPLPVDRDSPPLLGDVVGSLNKQPSDRLPAWHEWS